MVVATQNPAEMEGTYALPEAQRDRFMARVSMGYPAIGAEMAMLDSHGSTDPLQTLRAVSDPETVQRAVGTASGVHASTAVKQYLLDLVTATRRHPDLALGASPRASLHLLRAARASAALSGRAHVLPDDVQDLLVPVLAHRLLLTADAQLAQRSVGDVLVGLLRSVPVPSAGAAAR
jgi:MoxR-like ATPase